MPVQDKYSIIKVQGSIFNIKQAGLIIIQTETFNTKTINIK